MSLQTTQNTVNVYEKMQSMLLRIEPNQTVQRLHPGTKQPEILMFLGTQEEMPSGWFEMPKKLMS
jgi:hypothetical protein